MKDQMKLETLQEQVGLLDNDQGIVHLSLLDTDLYDLLLPYIPTVDYDLYFNFSSRIIIDKYAKMVSASKLSLVKKAIYYALKGEEYNLRTLINTTNLDYNPLENYEIHETIKTTASIASSTIHGELKSSDSTSITPYNNTTTTSYGAYNELIEKSIPEFNSTITESHSEYSETVAGEVNNGQRVTSGDSEHTVSAYNELTYQPSSKDETNTTTNAVKDTTSDVTTIPEYTITTTKQESPRSDIDVHNRGMHKDSVTEEHGEQKTSRESTVNEHNVNNNENQDQNRQRDLHGRYGFNTVQTMIEAERRLANLSISKMMTDIVIHTICQGVLYTW